MAVAIKKPSLEVRYQLGNATATGANSIVRFGMFGEREAAFKFARPEDPSRLSQLFRSVTAEALTLGRLKTWHAPKLFALLHDDEGYPVIVSERIHGPTLAALANTPAVEEMLIRIAHAAASVLDELSDAGTLHRDLKPDNFIINNARVVLIDYGFSAHLPETASGDIGIGSPFYAAPEVLISGYPSFDIQTDFYSLGVVLYEAATGRRPYHAEELSQHIDQVVNSKHIPIEDLRSDLSPRLKTLIECLLQKDPGLRPSDARELKELIPELKGPSPIAANTVSKRNVPVKLFPREASYIERTYREVTQSSGPLKPLIITGGCPKSNNDLLSAIQEDGWTQLGALQISIDCGSSEVLPLQRVGTYLDHLCYWIRKKWGPDFFERLALDDLKTVCGMVGMFSGLKSFFPKVDAELPSPDLVEPMILDFARSLTSVYKLILVFKNVSKTSLSSLEFLQRITRDDENVQQVYILDSTETSPKEMSIGAYDLVSVPRLSPDTVSKALSLGWGMQSVDQDMLHLLTECGAKSYTILNSAVQSLVHEAMLTFESNKWSLVDVAGSRNALQDLATTAAIDRGEGLNLPERLVAASVSIWGDSANLQHISAVLKGFIDHKLVIKSIMRLVELDLLERNPSNDLVAGKKSVLMQISSSLEHATTEKIIQKTIEIYVAKDHLELEDAFKVCRLLTETSLSDSPTLCKIYHLAADYAARLRSDDEANRMYKTALSLAATEEKIEILQKLCDFALLTHHVDDAESFAKTICEVTDNPEALARAYSVQSRCALAQLNAPKAFAASNMALSTFGSSYFKLSATNIRLILKNRVARLLPFVSKKSNPKERVSLSTQSSIFILGSLAAFHMLRPLHIVEMMIYAYRQTKKFPNSPPAVRTYLNIAIVFANIKMPKVVRKLLNQAKSISDAAFDKRLSAEVDLYSAYSIDFMGDPLTAARHAKNLANSSRAAWLDHADFLNMRYFLQWNQLIRGYFQLALDSMEDLSKKIYGSYHENDPRRLIEYSHSAALLATCGHETRSLELSRKALAVASSAEAENISVYYKAVYYAERLMYLGSIGAEETELDTCYAEYKAIADRECKNGPLLTVVAHYFYTIAKIHFIFDLKDQTSNLRIKSFCPAVWGLSRFRILRSHLSYFRACESFFEGDYDATLRLIRTTIDLAEEDDVPIIRSLATELKARVFSNQEQTEQALALLQETRRIAYATGDMRRFNVIGARLPANEQRMRTSDLISNMSSVVADKGVYLTKDFDRFVEAMRSISEALCNFSAPENIICDILDRMITLIRAERGAIYFLDTKGEIVNVICRDYEGNNLDPTGSVSRSVIEEAIKTQKAQVSGIDREENFTAASIVAHKLKSVAAIPLIYSGDLIAVSYFDSRAARGLFKNEHINLLNILANNVAVTLQSAKAINDEMKRKVMQRQLALTGAVQNLLIPGDRHYSVEDITLKTFFQTSAESGGDWFQYFHDKKRSALHVFVGDVTGHGPGPAMVTALVSGVFQQSIRSDDKIDIGQMIKDLDAAVHLTRDYFMSMIVVTIYLNSNQCEVYSCGGPHPILVPSNEPIKRLPVSGNPLGFEMPHAPSAPFQLGPGDLLLIPTDGLLEVMPSDGRKPRKAMSDILENARSGGLDLLQVSLEDYVSKRVPMPDDKDDDISWIAIQRR